MSLELRWYSYQMELSEEQKATIDRVRGSQGDVAPPWAEFPEYTRYTIGWRMGDGESWIWAWQDFMRGELRSTEARVACLRRHPRAPETWRRMLRWMLAPEGVDVEEDDATSDELDALIDEHELTGDDVAYGTWLARQTREGGVRAPWAGRGRPEDSMRYGIRPLAFWARWVHERELAGELQAWLDAQGRPPRAWRRIHGAMRGRSRELQDPRLRALCEMVRHGAPLPPWTSTHQDAPPDRPHRWDPPLLDSDVWLGWVFAAIDDEPSWRAYLSKHPPAPEPWREALTKDLTWSL